MTSLSQRQVAWLRRGGGVPASSPPSDAGPARAARRVRDTFDSRRRPAPELRAGVVLTIGWIALWTFFLVAIAHPAAQLHAHRAPAAAQARP